MHSYVMVKQARRYTSKEHDALIYEPTGKVARKLLQAIERETNTLTRLALDSEISRRNLDQKLDDARIQ